MEFNDKSLREAIQLWLKESAKSEQQYGLISTYNVSNVTNMENIFSTKIYV